MCLYFKKSLVFNNMDSLYLSIVIVNYNGKHYLKDCIDSIEKYCANLSFEIIIVDNNSSDGSQEFIRKKYPKIILFAKSENLGFGKANNLGVKYAKGHQILLLNNDTILMNDLKPVFNELKKTDVGIVGINMLNGEKKYTACVGKFPRPFDLLKLSNLNETRKEFTTGNFKKNIYEVNWISGSFMMLKKEDWNLVNGFDEDFFMYVEDVDLCKRMNNLGKKIIFLSNLSYIHFVGFNKSREIKLITGYKLYSRKHFNLVDSAIAQICLKINYVYKKSFKGIR